MKLKVKIAAKTCLAAAAVGIASSGVAQEIGNHSMGVVPTEMLRGGFRENAGQWDDQARFHASGKGFEFWMSDTGIVLDHYRIEEVDPDDAPGGSTGQSSDLDRYRRVGQVVRFDFVGAVSGSGRGVKEAGLPVDYFVGPKDQHATGVKSFNEAYVRDIYPNTHLRGYTEPDGSIRYDIVLMPGADPSKVQFAVSGANNVRLNDKGELVMDTVHGEITSGKPFTYQPVGNRMNFVESAYELNGNLVRINLGDFDPRLPVVIDPLVFGTYFGGGFWDQILGSAADSSGDLYMTGLTASVDFPVTDGPYDWNVNGIDAYLARLDGDAYRINYAAFIGGSQADVGRAIAFNEDTGDLWIGGMTNSTDLAGTDPLAEGGTFTGPNGDLFLTKFTVAIDRSINAEFSRYVNDAGDQGVTFPAARTNARNSNPFYPSYNQQDAWADMEVRSDGIAVLFGTADNAQLLSAGYTPNLPGAGGDIDGFIAMYDQSGANISKTLFGSKEADSVNNADIGPNDELVVSGSFSFTGSQDTSVEADPVFRTTAGVYLNGRTVRNGDSFVIKLDSLGDTVFSSILGGSNAEAAYGVAIDPAGSVYALGATGSFDFPRTQGAIGDNFSGGTHVYLTKIASDGAEIEISGSLPMGGNVLPWWIEVDERGAAYVGGVVGFIHPGPSPSNTIPGSIGTTGDALDGEYNCGDENVNFPNNPPGLTDFRSSVEGFIMVVNSAMNGLMYSDYIGQCSDDVVAHVAVDPVGAVWIVGSTERVYSPIGTENTPSGVRPYIKGSSIKTISNARVDGFAIKLRVGLPILDTVAFNPNAIAGGLGAQTTATIGLREPAPVGGVTMTATLSNPAISSFVSGGSQTTTTVFIPQGTQTITLPVYSLPVSQQEFSTLRVVLDNDFVEARLTVNPWLDEFAVAPSTIVGGNELTARVRLFQPALADTVVNLSVDREDLVSLPNPKQVVVPAGADNVSVLLPTAGVDAVENVIVTASLLGVAKDGPATIIPASLTSLIFSPDRINGGDDTTLRVVFDGKVGAARTVDLTHFSGETGLLVDGAGLPTVVNIPEQTQEVAVTATAPVVASSTFTTIEGTNNGKTVKGTLFIEDIDILEIQVDPGTDVIGGTLLNCRVVLTRAAGAGGFEITLASTNPDAGTLSTDTVTIPAGASISPDFEFQTKVVGADETTTLSAARSGFSTRTVDITVRGINLDLVLNPTEVTGGVEHSVGTLTIDQPAIQGGLTLDVTSSDPAATVPATITVAEGETSVDFDVTTLLVNADVTATITVIGSPSAQASADLLIKPLEIALVVDPDDVDGGDTTQGTITINKAAPAGGIQFTLASDNAAAQTPSTATVAEGETEVSFNITTSPVQVMTVATITATSPSGLEASDLLVIRAPQVVDLSISPSFVTGGDTAVGTVTLDRPASPGGITVALEADPTGIVSIPTEVVVEEGDTEASFNIGTIVVDTDTDVEITASTGTASVSATMVILSPAVVGITFNPGEVYGGQASTGTITLDAPAPAGGMVITITAVTPGYATADVATVTVAAGERTADFGVSTFRVSRRVAAEFRAASSVNEVSGLLLVKP